MTIRSIVRGVLTLCATTRSVTSLSTSIASLTLVPMVVWATPASYPDPQITTVTSPLR